MYEPPLDIIKEIAECLNSPLSTNKAKLKTHLIELESKRAKLAEARVDWMKTLHEAEQKVLHPKDPQLTELDRRIKLQADTAIVRRDYDFLVALEQLIGERLAFGRELLKDYA